MSNTKFIGKFLDPSCLPFGVFEHMLQFIDVDDLCRCTRLNKTWRKAANHPILWQYLAQVELQKLKERIPEFELEVSAKEFAIYKFKQKREQEKQALIAMKKRKQQEFTLHSLKVFSVANFILSMFVLPFVWRAHPELSKIFLGVITGLIIAKENVLERIWRYRSGRILLLGFATALVLVVAKEVGWVKDTNQTKEVQKEALVLLYLIHGYRYVGIAFLFLGAWVSWVSTQQDRRAAHFSIGLGSGFLVVSEFVLRINNSPILDHEPFFWQILEFFGLIWCFASSISLIKKRMSFEDTKSSVRSVLACVFTVSLSRLVLNGLNMESPSWLWIKTTHFAVRGIIPHAIPFILLVGLFDEVSFLNPSENTKRLLSSLYVSCAIVLEALLLFVGNAISPYFTLQNEIVRVLSKPQIFMYFVRRICIYSYLESLNVDIETVHTSSLLSWMALELIFTSQAAHLLSLMSDVVTFMPAYFLIRKIINFSMYFVSAGRTQRRNKFFRHLIEGSASALCILRISPPPFVTQTVYKVLHSTLDYFDVEWRSLLLCAPHLLIIGLYYFALVRIAHRLRNIQQRQATLAKVVRGTATFTSFMGISFVFFGGFVLRAATQKASENRVLLCPVNELSKLRTSNEICPWT